MENLYVDIGTQRVLKNTTTSVNSFWLSKKAGGDQALDPLFTFLLLITRK